MLFDFHNARNMKGGSVTYKAVVLICLLVAAESSNIQSKIPEPKWDNGLSATVNDYVENTISMLVPFLQKHGLDPMELPEIEEGFEIRILLITYSAWLRIHDGQMTGLVNVVRSGDQHVNYFEKTLRVRVQLRFSDLEFAYRYLVKVMNIGPTGGIIGSLEHFDVIADVLIDFNNDEIQLQQFSIVERGLLRVRLTGNILFDWLLNPVISVFTRIFNGVIMTVVELTIRTVARSAVAFINTNIREVIDYIESFSYNNHNVLKY